MKAIIDCGHGGLINGKYQSIAKTSKSYRFPDGFEVLEGVINRQISKKLEHKLQLANIPFISGNTHDQTDKPLQQRINQINKWYENDKSLFVLSIHANKMNPEDSGPSQAGTGFEIIHKDDAKSKSLADKLATLYKSELPQFRYRRTFTTPFLAILKTDCPSILCENLFYDNRKEAEYISSELGQENISDILFKFIKSVYGNLEA
jgi:N-acetylmuramoyl-L-alanine amidase